MPDDSERPYGMIGSPGGQRAVTDALAIPLPFGSVSLGRIFIRGGHGND